MSSFISDLLTFLISPLGLLTILGGFLLLLQAARSRQAAWWLFTLCAFASTLGEFRNEFYPDAPDLVFPLESLRAAGRPLTMLLLGMLVLLGWQAQGGWRKQLLPPPIKFLLLVQTVIFAKTLLYGSTSFALLTLLTIGAVVFAVRSGPSHWLQGTFDFELGVRSLASVSLLFVAANLYQALFDLYPITFVRGRFLGTTVNPQAAALLLASILPCLFFLIEKAPNQRRSQIFWAIILGFALFALLLTGSRTGMLMGLTTVLFFYRFQLRKLSRLLLILSVVALLLRPGNGLTNQVSIDFFDTVAERYTEGENSRQDVWYWLWDSFLRYPIFGTPLHGERLMGYGESSWLGTAAALGLAGLVPLCLFGFSALRMVIQVFLIGRQQPFYSIHANTVIAGISTIFVGSIFEASLLGNLAFSVLAIFFYFALGQYLLEVSTQASLASQPTLPHAQPRTRRGQFVYRPHPIANSAPVRYKQVG